MHKHTKLITIIMSLGLILSGCQSKQQSHKSTESSQIQTETKTDTNSNQSEIKKLKQLTYKPGDDYIVKINDNHSTLNMNDWKSNHIDYGKLDQGRTSNTTTAYLQKSNLADTSLRERQTVKPTGWHQKFDKNHTAILNRGHLIAYSFSKGLNQQGQPDSSIQAGDQNNYRNLFTETQYCNQKLQTIYEKQIRDALYRNEKVIYQVTPIFKGNDKMASGVWLQAKSSGSLDFNVYLFNVQPGYTFDYKTGYSRVTNN